MRHGDEVSHGLHDRLAHFLRTGDPAPQGVGREGDLFSQGYLGHAGMVTEHSENRSSGIFTKKCPLQSAPVHSSPLLSIPVHSSHIQFSPNAVAPKNPCYNWRMKRAPPCGLNPNHNLTLNRSVPTCRDRIARFQRACLSAAYFLFVSIRGIRVYRSPPNQN